MTDIQNQAEALSKVFSDADHEQQEHNAMMSIWDKAPEDQVQRLRDRVTKARQRREEKDTKMAQILSKLAPKKS